MNAVKELAPVTFNYKVDKSDKHCGFITEDVPELVATKDRKGLSQMDIVAVLTKVVQEQQKETNTFKEEVSLLKEEMKKIKDTNLADGGLEPEQDAKHIRKPEGLSYNTLAFAICFLGLAFMGMDAKQYQKSLKCLGKVQKSK